MLIVHVRTSDSQPSGYLLIQHCKALYPFQGACDFRLGALDVWFCRAMARAFVQFDPFYSSALARKPITTRVKSESGSMHRTAQTIKSELKIRLTQRAACTPVTHLQCPSFALPIPILTTSSCCGACPCSEAAYITARWRSPSNAVESTLIAAIGIRIDIVPFGAVSVYVLYTLARGVEFASEQEGVCGGLKGG